MLRLPRTWIPVLLLTIATVFGPGQVRAAEPLLEKIDLFEAGKLGYTLYHIPGILVTAKGSVLAWCEARKKGSDWDAIDILLRRSTDDGKTWSEPKRIAEVPGPITKNPFALAVKGVLRRRHYLQQSGADRRSRRHGALPVLRRVHALLLHAQHGRWHLVEQADGNHLGVRKLPLGLRL